MMMIVVVVVVKMRMMWYGSDFDGTCENNDNGSNYNDKVLIVMAVVMMIPTLK